jgi:hypothetical protein
VAPRDPNYFGETLRLKRVSAKDKKKTAIECIIIVSTRYRSQYDVMFREENM